MLSMFRATNLLPKKSFSVAVLLLLHKECYAIAISIAIRCDCVSAATWLVHAYTFMHPTHACSEMFTYTIVPMLI